MFGLAPNFKKIQSEQQRPWDEPMGRQYVMHGLYYCHEWLILWKQIRIWILHRRSKIGREAWPLLQRIIEEVSHIRVASFNLVDVGGRDITLLAVGFHKPPIRVTLLILLLNDMHHISFIDAQFQFIPCLEGINRLVELKEDDQTEGNLENKITDLC